MKIEGRRRSDNFEDRGSGRGAGGGRGVGVGLLQLVVRRFGLPGVIVAGLGLMIARKPQVVLGMLDKAIERFGNIEK